MDPERPFETHHDDDVHVKTMAELRGQLQSQLANGAFDVLRNGHEDEIILSDGQHEYHHHLSRAEAERIEEAAWSAGEDRTIDALIGRVVRDLSQTGFDLRRDTFDITLNLRPETTTS